MLDEMPRESFSCLGYPANPAIRPVDFRERRRKLNLPGGVCRVGQFANAALAHPVRREAKALRVIS
jgi:hypothetical protein